MLVRTHRPSLELLDHVLHTVERHCHRFVVSLEVVVHRHTESRALVRKERTERDVLRADSEGDERCYERGIRVEERAVEIEDGNDGRSQTCVTSSGLTRRQLR